MSKNPESVPFARRVLQTLVKAFRAFSQTDERSFTFKIKNDWSVYLSSIELALALAGRQGMAEYP